MLFHDSSTRRDNYTSLFESDEFPLWVDFGKQKSLTVHSFQVISTSSKVIIFLHVRNKGKVFLKKRVQMEHGWQAPPSPLPTRGNMENCKKMQKGGLKRFRLIRGELMGFFMLSMFCYGWQEVLGPFLVGAVPLLPSDVTKIKFQTYLMSNNRLVIPQLLHDAKKTRLFSIKL